MKGLRYRKRVKLGKYAWLNISKSGVSMSVGGRGYTTNIGRNGTRQTVGIPGSGLSYSKYSSYNKNKKSSPSNSSNNSENYKNNPEVTETEHFESASFNDIGSPAFEAFSDTLNKVAKETNALHYENQQLESETNELESEVSIKPFRKLSVILFPYALLMILNKFVAKPVFDFSDGFFTSLLWWVGCAFLISVLVSSLHFAFSKKSIYSNWFRKILALKRQHRFNLHRVSELKIPLDMEESELKLKWTTFISAFQSYSNQSMLCDQISSSSIDNKTHRSEKGTTVIDIKDIECNVEAYTYFESELLFPKLENSNGADLIFTPLFVLIESWQQDYELGYFYPEFQIIGYDDFDISLSETSFIDRGNRYGGVVVGSIWNYANLNGSRDKRMKDNYEISVIQTASLSLTSLSGLNEVYISNKYAVVDCLLSNFNEYKLELSIALNDYGGAPSEDDDPHLLIKAHYKDRSSDESDSQLLLYSNSWLRSENKYFHGCIGEDDELYRFYCINSAAGDFEIQFNDETYKWPNEHIKFETDNKPKIGDIIQRISADNEVWNYEVESIEFKSD